MLVTYSVKDFTDVAILLAENEVLLSNLKNKLKSGIASSNLVDGEAYMKDLERLSYALWEIEMATQQPQQMHIVLPILWDKNLLMVNIILIGNYTRLVRDSYILFVSLKTEMITIRHEVAEVVSITLNISSSTLIDIANVVMTFSPRAVKNSLPISTLICMSSEEITLSWCQISGQILPSI